MQPHVKEMNGSILGRRLLAIVHACLEDSSLLLLVLSMGHQLSAFGHVTLMSTGFPSCANALQHMHAHLL